MGNLWGDPTGKKVYRLWRLFVGKGAEIVKLRESQAEEWRTCSDWQRIGEFLTDDTYETFKEAVEGWKDWLGK